MEFDFVVMGAGSAGCALAAQLARSELSVCLVEAGPDYGPASGGRWPEDLLDVRARPLTHDWGYLRAGARGPVPESRACVFGGCSAHNQAAAIWPPPADFDAWAAAGNAGWAYNEVLPLIQELEADSAATPSGFRGLGGPLPTRVYEVGELAFWQRRFLDSAVGLGYPRLADLSDPSPPEGVMPYHANVRDTVRWNSAFAFLDPVRERPNLHLLSDTLAAQLEFSGDAVTELVCRSAGGEVRLRAKRFVLTAGTYGSPALLLRSGVGPAPLLKRLGIPLEVELPGVGRNLQEHPGVGLRYQLNEVGRHLYEKAKRSGAIFPSQVAMRARSDRCEAGFDLHLLPSQTQLEGGEWTFELLAFHMSSDSRGLVEITGADPGLPLQIDFRYFEDQGRQDATILCDGTRLLRRLALSGPLAEVIEAEAEPGQGVTSVEALTEYAQASVRGYAHCVGTCKMGPAADRLAVVDALGLVHGLGNLYVADASIIPEIPRANTNLVSCLIGWRAGKLMREAQEAGSSARSKTSRKM